MRLSRLSRLLLGSVLLTSGCTGSLSVSQRLAGEWLGRPETATERTVREWPGHASGEEVSPSDPEVAAAIATAPVTDLETLAPDVEVAMRLGELGKAELSLDGEQPLAGKWTVTPIDGRRATLEIEVDPAEEDAAPVRRRFDIEFFREGEAFTLREQSADRRFGRLVFRRPGAASTGDEIESIEPIAESAADDST